MCGIAGLISNPKKPLPKEQLSARINAMQAALEHRGPDHQAVYFSPTGNASICHTRLSIVDLNKRANQPMLSDDGRFVLSFNGEIYNYKKLRTQLQERGVTFQSNSDTEVVLKYLIQYGPKGLRNLRGMFALALWDEKHQSLLVARDPLGVKPLYYCARHGTLAFASEVRSLLESKLSSRKLSSRGVNQYLLRGSFSEPDTAFTDIKLLPAGTYFLWREDQPSLQRYWKPRYSAKSSMNRDKAIELTRSTLEHCVKAHMVSDVPIGLFLSGGIDSTILLALASKLSTKKIRTYSIAFEDPQWNEGDIAKKTAQHFGSEHTEWKISAEQAQDLFDDFLSSIDQPTIDGFNVYCAAKLASENGEKVVLSGLGGDELFSGYPSFTKLPLLKKKAERLKWLSFLLLPARQIIEKLLPPKNRRGLDLLFYPDSISIVHQSFRGIFSINEASKLAHDITGKESTASFPKIRARDLADQISELEMSVYCRNQLLRDSDVFSMAHGLELRVPFIDKVLVEQILTIPAKWRLEKNKQLLIDSVPELPEWVIDQPKNGFRFPFEDWLTHKWSGMPTTKETPKWIPLSPWYRQWSLSVLDDWLSRHAK